MERRGNLEDYVDEAITNIRQDRAITSALLTDIMLFLKKNEQNHKEVGAVAAKYVETLQRSNEQLVKIANLLQKKEEKSFDGLTADDHKEIFDIIGGSDNG